MNVFLTGGTGNAGHYVRRELLERGMKVVTLVRNPVQLEGCRTVVGELSNLDRLAAEIGQADSIIHLACPRTQEGASVLNEDIRGTASLIDAWRKGSFLYASSPTIHGIPTGMLTEQSAVRLDYWYDAGKYTNEFQLRMAERYNGRGPAIRMRPGLLFGSGERRHDDQYLGWFFRHCQLGSKFLFDSDEGLAKYGSSFIGGEDFGRAVASLMTAKSGAYNIAGGFCTWKSVIDTFNRIAGTRGDVVVRTGAFPEPGEARPPQSVTLLDTSALVTETGFVPRQDLEQLVGEFVEAEREGTKMTKTDR
jgi:nucleoside-diphosphate-sugar epimerase